MIPAARVIGISLWRRLLSRLRTPAIASEIMPGPSSYVTATEANIIIARWQNINTRSIKES